MTLWFFPVALVVLVALASLTSIAVGGRGSPPRPRRRPTPHRRCPTCQIPAHQLPVVCGYPDCPEVKPIKMTYAEYIEISDHLK